MTGPALEISVTVVGVILAVVVSFPIGVGVALLGVTLALVVHE